MAGESLVSCEIFSSSVMRDRRSLTRESIGAAGFLYCADAMVKRVSSIITISGARTLACRVHTLVDALGPKKRVERSFYAARRTARVTKPLPYITSHFPHFHRHRLPPLN